MDDKTVIINGTERITRKNAQGSYIIFADEKDIEYINSINEKLSSFRKNVQELDGHFITFSFNCQITEMERDKLKQDNTELRKKVQDLKEQLYEEDRFATSQTHKLGDCRKQLEQIR